MAPIYSTGWKAGSGSRRSVFVPVCGWRSKRREALRESGGGRRSSWKSRRWRSLVRQHFVERWGLRRSENGRIFQHHRLGRNSRPDRPRRQLVRLIRENHPVVVVIRARDLDNPVLGPAVIMRRETRAQRSKDKEQSTGQESTGAGASHAVSSPGATDSASALPSGKLCPECVPNTGETRRKHSPKPAICTQKGPILCEVRRNGPLIEPHGSTSDDGGDWEGQCVREMRS